MSKLDWGLTMITLGCFIVLNPVFSAVHEAGHAYVCSVNGNDFIIQPGLTGTYFACDKFTGANADLIRTQMYFMGGFLASASAFAVFAILKKAKVLSGKKIGIGYALVTIGLMQFIQTILETFVHDLYMKSHITIPIMSMGSLVVLLIFLFRGSKQFQNIQNIKPIVKGGDIQREIPQNIFKRDIRDIILRRKPTEAKNKKYQFHEEKTHTSDLLGDEVDRYKAEIPEEVEERLSPKPVETTIPEVEPQPEQVTQIQKPKKRFSTDFFVVAAVMTGILLPVRLVFVEFVSDSTLGSLGLISAISVTIVVLSKKNKLGKFGRIFEKEMTRLTRGKKRIFILAWFTMLTLYFAFSIYSIEQANTVFYDEKERIKLIIIDTYTLDFERPDTMIETLEPEAVVGGVDDYASAVVNDFEAVAITQGIMNDLSNGFLLHFHTVFLVEGLEILGLFIFYSVVYRNKKLTQEVTA